MQTLRARLTAWYSGALALTLAAFAGVLYLDRRSASYQDLDQRIQSEAALTAGILAESYPARGTLGRAATAGRRRARRPASARAPRPEDPLCGALRHRRRTAVRGDSRRSGRPHRRTRPGRAALDLRPGAPARARPRPADGVVDFAARARRRGSAHHRGPRDHRRTQPASAPRRAADEGRARPARRDAEPDDDPARARLRRPAGLHGPRDAPAG